VLSRCPDVGHGDEAVNYRHEHLASDRLHLELADELLTISCPTKKKIASKTTIVCLCLYLDGGGDQVPL
jgi:hypothetical protein